MTRRARLWLAGAVLAGFAGGLATCEHSLRDARIALCRRAVPALLPAEADLTIQRTGTGPAPGSVRVDYRVGGRPHWAVCRFAGGSELTGLATDRAEVPEASLYLLKRFYLDTPEAAAADPARP